MGNKLIEGDIDVKFPMPTVEITATSRINMAPAFLRAARRFSDKAGELEAANQGAEFGGFFDEIKEYAASSIVMAVAALEANVNEVIDDLKITDIDQRDPSILPKYLCVLENKRKQVFDKGKNPYQDVSILIRLRNALVHFKPEWDDAIKDHGKLSKKLTGKFPLSPFLENDTRPIFPLKCMSHGCTEWAVNTSLSLMREFERLLDRRIGKWDRF